MLHLLPDGSQMTTLSFHLLNLISCLTILQSNERAFFDSADWALGKVLILIEFACLGIKHKVTDSIPTS